MNKKTRMTILAVIIAVSVLFFVRSFMKTSNGQEAVNGDGPEDRMIAVGPNRRQATQMVLKRTEQTNMMQRPSNRMIELKRRLAARQGNAA